jgi:hypothetical protein
MSGYELGLAVLLVVWLAISVLMQVRIPRIQMLRRFDILSVVPQFNFFAPTPGTKDYHLLYRIQTEVGEFGAWREVTLDPQRRWSNIIWNPERRERKALFDLVTTLAQESQHCGEKAIQVSVPYLVFLNHVSRLLPNAMWLRVQFMVMISHGTLTSEQPRTLFISQVHKV